MAFKKIKLINTKCCPECGGKEGVFIHQIGNLRRGNAWGASYKLFKDDKIITQRKLNKTVSCNDCGQRFTLIKKDV